MRASGVDGHEGGPVRVQGTSRFAGVARSLERVISILEPVLRVIAGVGIVLLMLATAMDVGSRVTTGRSLPGVIEVTEVMLVIAVYFALVTAGRDGQHIRVLLLTDRLSATAARIVRSVGLAISLIIVCWLTWATIGKAIHSVGAGEYRIGLANVPMWPARVAIPVGLIFLAVVLLFLLVAQLFKYSSVIGRESQPLEGLLEDPTAKDPS